MQTRYLCAGLIAAIFSVCVATSPAQVTSSPSSSMAVPVASEPMTNPAQTVSYKHKFLFFKFGKSISKAITVQPGNGEISLDGMGRRGDVQLTLINPSATPLQFETIGRSGSQTVAVIPAHSQRLVTFSNKGNDIKFFVMQQPDNAVATNQDYTTQQAAAVATTQNVAIRDALDQQTAMINRSQDSQTAELKNSQEQTVRAAMFSSAASQRRQENRSAVRGYW